MQAKTHGAPDGYPGISVKTRQSAPILRILCDEESKAVVGSNSDDVSVTPLYVRMSVRERGWRGGGGDSDSDDAG